jgi:hypothetical protein
VLLLFVGIAAGIAQVLERQGSDYSPQARLAYGAAGALVVLGGAAFLLVGKGKGGGIIKGLVSKPNLCPPMPVVGPAAGMVSTTGSGGAGGAGGLSAGAATAVGTQKAGSAAAYDSISRTKIA